MPENPGYSVSLIVPTLNEALNIQELIRRVHQVLSSVTNTFEIIVVDDSSEDGTADLAGGMIAVYPNVRVLRRGGARDLSRSVIDGWTAARGDILVVIDSDLQHPPERLADLLSAMGRSGADIAVASRNVRGGGVSKWALHRRVVSWTASLIATFLIPGILRMVRDPMSGFFAIRRKLLENTRFNPHGYKILLEVLARSPYESLVEVPYVFEERKKGESKLGARQMIDYLVHIFRLSCETGEIKPVLKYLAVGASGMLVNALVYAALRANPVLPYEFCFAAGFETSVLSNFLLNELWTFDAFKIGGAKHISLSRLLKFQFVSLISLAVALLALALCVNGFHLPPRAAAVIAIVLAGMLNFFANTHITWLLWCAEDVMLPDGTVKRLRRLPARESPVTGLLHRH